MSEPIAPPRPWWRMTARPPAGFVLAAIFLLNSLSQLIPLAAGVITASEIAILIGHGVIGIAYLHSSVRLRRGGAAETPFPTAVRPAS